MQLKTPFIALLTICLLCSSALGQNPGSAKELIAKLPQKDVASAKAVMEELVKIGAGAVKEIAAAVQPSGTRDADARFALNGLAHPVSRPGAEAERAMYTAAIIT